MEWNLIKAFMMDWNTKRYFEVGDTFVKSYIQPQVWQLLELFGDGSDCESTRLKDMKLRDKSIREMFNTPLTVGKLLNMCRGNYQNQMEYERFYEPDIKAWSHLMCKAYGAKPEKHVYTMSNWTYSRPPMKREAPTSVLSSKPSKGKVGNTPVWCSKTRAEKVKNEGGNTVSVTRPVEFSNLTVMDTKVNKHVLNFCPLREEYGGHGHLHTGAFPVEVLGYGKIHNDFLEKPSTVTKKKLCETFGDQGVLWNKNRPGAKYYHPTVLSHTCLKPWSEDTVITVEKVCHCCQMITLKVQKVKYLWNVEVSNDDEGNTTINAIEYPDPSTKYPNGVVMTRIFKAPIIKTKDCWIVEPECYEHKHYERLYNNYIHGIETLVAMNAFVRKGQSEEQLVHRG